jgi:hypothetical protein
MSEDQTNTEDQRAADDQSPLAQRAAIAARAELRGERTRILGATGAAPGYLLICAGAWCPSAGR